MDLGSAPESPQTHRSTTTWKVSHLGNAASYPCAPYIRLVGQHALRNAAKASPRDFQDRMRFFQNRQSGRTRTEPNLARLGRSVTPDRSDLGRLRLGPSWARCRGILPEPVKLRPKSAAFGAKFELVLGSFCRFLSSLGRNRPNLARSRLDLPRTSPD